MFNSIHNAPNGEFTALAQQASPRCLDEKYATEFPFLAMPDEFKEREKVQAVE